MKKLIVATIVLAAFCIGSLALLAEAGGEPGPPCNPDFQCLDYWDPVTCVKPGVGWRTYSNACYAARDCAIGKTCRPYIQ